MTNTSPLTAPARDLLIEKASNAHRAVGAAMRAALPAALDAGDALNELKAAVSHGAWGGILRKCEIGERMAQLYMKLARGRAVLEANPQRVSDLSLRGALRLLSAKPTERKPKSTATPQLNLLAWSESSPEQRRHFLDGIGLVSIIAAMPPDWRVDLARRAKRAASPPSSKLPKASLALRQALSLQMSSPSRDTSAVGVANALNGILNLFKSAGLSIHDIEIVGSESKEDRLIHSRASAREPCRLPGLGPQRKRDRCHKHRSRQ